MPVSICQTGVGHYQAEVKLTGSDRVSLSLRDTDHSLMKTFAWQRDYSAEYRLDHEPNPELSKVPRFDSARVRAGLSATAVYQDISHWFGYGGFALLIGGIAARRL
jgi:hypothetical protein